MRNLENETPSILPNARFHRPCLLDMKDDLNPNISYDKQAGLFLHLINAHCNSHDILDMVKSFVTSTPEAGEMKNLIDLASQQVIVTNLNLPLHHQSNEADHQSAVRRET